METPSQDDLQKFVNNNVGECQSSLVDMLLEKEIFSWDDIKNKDGYVCPECGHNEADESAFETEDANVYLCPYCKKTFEDAPENEPQEPLEWWTCSSWLMDKLEAYGEPVLRTDYGDWYGRTCSGQSMILDSVIENIYMHLRD